MFVRRIVPLWDMGIDLQDDEPLVIRLDDRRHTEIVLQATYDYVSEADEVVATETTCTIERKVNVTSTIRAIFDDLAHGRLPPAVAPSPRTQTYLRADGSLRPDARLDVRDFPQSFQDFVRGQEHETLRACLVALRWLRWRMGIEGPHNPVQVDEGVAWSLDGADWRPMPRTRATRIYTTRYPKASEVPVAELVSLLRAPAGDQAGEPLGHDVWREAWHQRYTNPRSALVIGMAALETGVKDFVSEFVPGAQWLMENIPSAPMAPLLEDYLPTLTTKQGCVIRLPKSFIERIREGAHARNRTAHVGRRELEGSKLSELLLTIQDILWLLDYHRGYDWAWEYVRSASKTALTSL